MSVESEYVSLSPPKAIEIGFLMNVTALIYQLKVMSYQLQIESRERREAEDSDDSLSNCCLVVICGICILPIPLGFIAGISLIEWPTSNDISDSDDTEKNVLRYLLKS